MHAILLDDSTNEEGQEFLLEEFHSPDTSVGNRESLARCKGVLLAAGSIMQRIVGQPLEVLILTTPAGARVKGATVRILVERFDTVNSCIFQRLPPAVVI